jgi:PHD/YefM family antitoxin component YafN of YafNO toxin-antitoxin module
MEDKVGKTITRDQFPIIYDHGKPQAVIVDVKTFDQLVQTVAHLQQLADDPEEIKWVSEIVDRARTRWQAHPEEVMTFDTPEAAMAFLDEPEPA